MGERGRPLLKRHLHRYFGHIYDECLAFPSLREEELKDWTDTERIVNRVKASELFLHTMITMLVFVFPMAYMYIIVEMSWNDLTFLAFFLGLVVIFIIVFLHDLLLRSSPDSPGPRPFLKDWPAQVKKFDTSMTDCVMCLSKTFSCSDINVRMFSVVLHNRKGEPHGMVLMTKRNFVRITVWKHWTDSEHTVVHIAPTNARRKKVIKRIQGIVDTSLEG